ncbi:lipoxygenase homology domain-containing protein 1-like [Hemiscyllium ocellatum]|uniref:lipoxygenase homology domain-containing protein 1-like n=1 Tax=Hemiscyllium ocellatum TaxID=170820 RepID=UPI002965F3F6|nr:lipoxygenase homology domain-containing protein 1-like [Hemiscyllium ocellatum]
MQPEGIKTTLVAYGSKGKSEEIVLSSDKPESPHFLPGAIDEFIIFIENIGDIYKIRVNGEELGSYVGWHLVSIALEDLKTKQVFIFNCNTQLSATNEDKELVKEFSVAKGGQNLLPVNHYLVYVHIGDRWAAETYANVFVILHGERGDTGIRKLEKSLVHGEKFQQSKIDSFLVKAVSLGQLTKVVIGHDGEGYGAGMYLKMVIVRESKDANREWVFPCWSWLDDHIGTKQTICELTLLGERLTVRPKGVMEQSSDIWLMDISSSDVKNNPGLQIIINVYGKDGQRMFTVGIADELTQAELGGVGLVYKLRVTPKANGRRQPWKLDSINLKRTATKEELWFTFNWWIKPNVIQGKELPALNPLEDPLPVVEYSVHIHTGDEANAGAVGTVFIIVHGDKGDSGKQWLTKSNSELVTFDRGKVDIFRFSAVYLGKLHDIVIGYNSQRKDHWFLEKAVITEGEMPVSRFIFVHNDWIGKHQKVDEFSEVIIHIKESADIFTNPLKHVTIDRKERWNIWILRMADSSGIIQKPEIFMVVFGTKGKTALLEIPNMKNIPFEVSLKGIGEIKKVSFVLLNPYRHKGIRLFKLRMKNLKTKQELGFNTSRRWLFRERGTETVTELAAVQPDRQPLRDILYSVQVFTGDVPAASTDTDVFVMIVGEHGDTCKRRLGHPNAKPFEKHQVSNFHIQAVDLGIPTEVHVGHNATGYGAGWYLDAITVMEPAENKGTNEYVFPCEQWLDNEVADRQTKRMLKLLGKVSNESKMLTESLQGSWDVFVVTSDMPNSGTDVEVILTICCKNGSAAPIILKKGSLNRGCTYQTSISIDDQLGTITKVRLEREESKNEDFWHCQKVNVLIIESVDVGELRALTIQMKGGFDLYLKKIIVQEGKYAMVEHIFMHQQNEELVIDFKKQRGEDALVCFSGAEVEMAECVKLLEVNIPEDIGNPWKIRLGLGKPGKKTAPATSSISLRYFKMQNITNLATFSYSINESLPVESNNDKCLEFPVEWPYKPTMSVLTYQITMYCSDFLDIEHPASISLCLYGVNGDTGDRSLSKPLRKETGASQSYLFEISAVELGELNTLELYISSPKNLKMYVKEIYVTEVTSPRLTYVFTLDEYITVHSKRLPIIKKVPLSGMLSSDYRKPSSVLSVKDTDITGAPNEVDEYLVQVYTGDNFGDRTNANVYLVLFGDKACSDKIPLTQTLDHKDPFRKGQIDTFKFKTDLLGSLYKIEIGHDGGKPGSGWFLEKIGITNLITNENLVFPFNSSLPFTVKITIAWKCYDAMQICLPLETSAALHN